MSRRKPNLRRISSLVTAQTAANLEHLRRMADLDDVGQVIDALVREKMIFLRYGREDPGRGR